MSSDLTKYKWEGEVEGSPDYVLGEIKEFLASDTYGLGEGVKYFGGIDALDVGKNEIAAYLDPGRYKLAVATWVILSIVTLGSAIVPWMLWGICRPWLALPRMYIDTYPTRDNNRTRIVIRVVHHRDRSEFARPIAQFLETKLDAKSMTVAA